MKHYILPLAITALLLTGCGERVENKENPTRQTESGKETEHTGGKSTETEVTRQNIVETEFTETEVIDAGIMSETAGENTDDMPHIQIVGNDGSNDGSSESHGTEMPEKISEKAASEEDVSEEAVSEEAVSEGNEAVTENMTENKTENMIENTLPDPVERMMPLLEERTAQGEMWSVGIVDLGSGQIFGENSSHVMQSASVIKVFIMGAVYDRILYPEEGKAIPYTEGYEGELAGLIGSMITVSSNDAANVLVTILGSGDSKAGQGVVNAFCQEHGYTATSMGRLFLESNPSGDNYTSAADCSRILTDIYRGDLVNEEASARMLEWLKQQTVRYKIPAGLPEGYSSANKTGEMPEGYGLGCIENDIAVVFSPYGDYVLAVLSNDLGGRNSEAQSVIAELSGIAAAWNREAASNPAASDQAASDSTVSDSAASD